MRSITLDITVDPHHFTALQLQPRATIVAAFNGASTWLRTHLGGHGKLLRTHHLGFVLYGVHLVYREPATYFDAETLGIEVTARARKAGAQLEFAARVTAGAAHAADVTMSMVPLEIADDEAFSGVPNRIEGELLQKFQADELDDGAYVSPIAERLASLTKLVAEHREPFVVHRHHCEFADQWFFPELLAFVGASREQLIRKAGGKQPTLRRGLGLPCRAIDILYERPYYLLDRGEVATTAYDEGGRLVFAHAAHGDDGRRALVIESF